jgi:diguanylate cyclase (GGDEF)-like protein/PAS domain S-box-containing protein
LNLSQASGQGNDPTLTNRIQQAAFALTMLVVLAIGGSSLAITLLQIPNEERHLHNDAVRIIGARMTSDLANEIAGVERLANSSLIWTALTDSFGRDAYLQPYLTGRDNIESGERILLLDYRARPVAGLAPDDVDASVLSAFAHDVLGGASPRFRIASNGHPTLLAGFPVIFPYTEEAIGVLVASIDLHVTFRTATVGIAEHHGIALLHQDGEIESELARVPAEPRDVRYPVRFPIQLSNHPQAELLSLSYYSTGRHWLGPVLTLVGVYLVLALVLGIAVWLVARYIAARVTRRLNVLADACGEIAKGRRGEIPDDPSRDEIGVLSRTLRHAIEAYDRINLGLEERIRQKTAELSAKERRQRQLLQAMAEGVVLVDAQKRIAYVNPAASAILDIDPQRMVGRVLDVSVSWRPVHEDGHDLRPDEFPAVRALMTGEPQRDVVTGVHRPDGELRWLAINAEPIHPQPGASPDGVVLSFRDITDRRRMETELRTAATVFSNLAEAVIVTDRDNHIVAVNPAFSRITGYAPGEVLGRNPSLLASGRHDQAYYRAMWADITDEGRWQGEMWNRKKDGEIYPQWAAISAVPGSDGNISGYVSVFSDITSIKQTEMELRQLAYFDPLTGLVNRMLFEERVERAVSRAIRSGGRFAILFIDLDRFKNVNDSLGHEAGDLLLREVGSRIAARVRKSDTVSRRSGDEFTVLIEPCPSRADAARLAEELLGRLAEAVTLPSGTRIFTGGSIGIALYPDDGDNVSDLLRNADTAMYAAKEGGRGRYCFYSDEPG